MSEYEKYAHSLPPQTSPCNFQISAYIDVINTDYLFCI